jgi:hypothetical protein
LLVHRLALLEFAGERARDLKLPRFAAGFMGECVPMIESQFQVPDSHFLMLMRRPINHGIVKSASNIPWAYCRVRGELIGSPLCDFGTKRLANNVEVFPAGWLEWK